MPSAHQARLTRNHERPEVVVIWIDWYAYHVARFRGLDQTASLRGRVLGIELVGGIGVHSGLKFRESLPADAAIETLEPEAGWSDVNKLQLARKLWSRLTDLDPRMVLVPGYYTLPAIAAAIWARAHGATCVLMTESCSFDHQRSVWKETVKSLGLRLLFDWAVAGGKAHIHYLQQLRFPADRVVGSYDVVDNTLFGVASDRQRRGFLYVGRLAPEKNVATLLESWIAYRAGGGCWPLTLLGDGSEAEALKERARTSPFIDDLFFPGLKKSRELLPFYRAAGCFVLPSTREPWGLVVNEAMAAGLPVIVSSRCGCTPDLVEEGSNGWLFDPMDGNSLTCLLHRVEELSLEQRIAMSESSTEIIARYTPNHFGRSIAAIAKATKSNHANPHNVLSEAQ